ncbi:MAG TPA: nucleotidyltransferase domain-containing protein [Thermoanaerobaculia bacterium]|nr:nucleotidyltransferase domain-containing protein [Thermoanaerobaculia bacterium]
MDELAQRIREAAAGLPLSILVVFGSRARGRERLESDLDVAILPTADSDLPRRKLQARLASALGDLAPDGRVDVVFLDEAPELLRQRIMESGRLVVCDDQAAWRHLRVATMREHGDRAYYRRMLREAQHERLTKRRPSGRSGRALRSLERVGKLSG